MGSLGEDRAGRRRILFIDSFDSFTNNIVGLLEQCLSAEVTLVHIDDEYVDEHFDSVVAQFDAVVVGPGPGHPGNPSDVGFIGKLWKLEEAHLLPVLGICLGFQSLCLSQGAKVRQLSRARHGIVNKVAHNDTDIFAGLGHLEATQYHSLHVDIGLPTGHVQPKIDGPSWDPSEQCPLVLPLAWDADDGINGPILMAARHVTMPFWGVQFHPESICTSEGGKTLLRNWWSYAQNWLVKKNRRTAPRGHWTYVSASSRHFRGMQASSAANGGTSHPSSTGNVTSHLVEELRSVSGKKDTFLRWGRHAASGISPHRLLEALGQSQNETILLDSQGHSSGRYSILGLVVPGRTMKVTYKVSSQTLEYGIGPGQMSMTRLDTIEEVWPILQDVLDQHNPRGNPTSRASTPGEDLAATGMDRFVAGHLPEDSPFWGGFMGYISYEAGLDTLGVDLHPKCATSGAADINFAFIHRSIVIDHETSQVYIQSLLPGDWSWILDAGRVIDNLVSQEEETARFSQDEERTAKRQKTNGCTEKTPKDIKEEEALNRCLANAEINRPLEEPYRQKVLRCQEVLASGDSYELCLTDETEICIPGSGASGDLDSWALYKRLRKNNPAPFGAFMRLSGVSVVGSSPERFLRWTRDGRCQFRPIKGTVKKGGDMTNERAHAILGSSKERAENLMIVDLIRHDLSGVIGADKTWVSKLMVVEEYETVYQLVSVIEGQLPEPAPEAPRGIHVLKASLPPGSMTGAPKKRSCEVLRDIEQRPRGIYSGVLGYMDVGGAGDFSVVIRTAVSDQGPSIDANTDSEKTDQSQIWRVGAGGAVTIQSTDEGEFQEMEAKQSSVLGSLLHQNEK